MSRLHQIRAVPARPDAPPGSRASPDWGDRLMDFRTPGRSNVGDDPAAPPATRSRRPGRPSVGRQPASRWRAAGKAETMTDPWAVLAGLGVIAFAFVLVPVVGSV